MTDKEIYFALWQVCDIAYLSIIEKTQQYMFKTIGERVNEKPNVEVYKMMFLLDQNKEHYKKLWIMEELKERASK
jgi:hypothetical protein